MSVAIYPVEFIQTPKQITIISEAFSEVRRVYMGAPQAKVEDVAPGFYGRSAGRWSVPAGLLESNTSAVTKSASLQWPMPSFGSGEMLGA